MKKSVGLWQLMGFAVTSLGGTILHFLYEWTNESIFVAPFSGVNESTWEHMKLLFFPMLIFALFQSLFFRGTKEFWCVKLYGTLLGLALIPIIFYTYNGAIGESPDWINIAIFFISAACAYYFEYRLFKSGRVKCKHGRLALAMLLIIAVLFVVFTFYTPKIGIFRDPLSNLYGILPSQN